MPIRWIEGFDAMNSAAAAIDDDWLRRYTVVDSPEAAGVELVAGRTGGLAWMHPGGGAPTATIRTKPAMSASVYWTVGMALRLKEGTGDLLKFFHATDLVNAQLTVTLSNAGGTLTTITVKRGATTLGTYDYDFPDVWTYVEFETAITQSTELGFVNVYINGTVVLSISGVSTAAAVTSGAGHVQFSGTTSDAINGEFLMDDIYIAGGVRGVGESALPPGVLGDCVVQEAVPDADGDQVDSDPVGAVDVFDTLDDPNGETDDDTSYADTVGSEAVTLLEFPDFTDFGEEVVAVEIEEHSRGITGGGVYHAPAVKFDGTTVSGDPVSIPTAGVYGVVSHILEENPVTEEAWEFDDVNTSQFGFEQDPE